MTTSSASIIREVLAVAVGAGTIVAGVAVLPLSLIIALPVATTAGGIAWAGMHLLLPGERTAEDSVDPDRAEVQQSLGRARTKANELDALGRSASRPAVKELTAATCATANGILDDLSKDSGTRLSRATTVEGLLTQTLAIGSAYQDLFTHKIAAPEERRLKLLTDIETTTLPQIRDAFVQLAQNLDEGEVMQLESTLKSVAHTLKLDGLI